MEKNGIIVVAALVLMACSHSAEQAQLSQPMRVHTMVVEPQEGVRPMRYVGTIEAARETPLSMQHAGRVNGVYVSDGSRVKAGQTLVTIDDTQARNALVTAQATLRHARDGYDRTSKVHDKGVISDQKMVEIETELAQAQAVYDAAKKQLDECTLTAPCSGVVHGLNIEVGQTIMPGATVCTLLDLSAFNVRFSVPENEIGALHELGQQGQMECAAVGKTYPIEVTQRGVKAHALSHTYDVQADIQGGQEQLMAGMVGVVTLCSDQPSAIVIPARCVVLMQDGQTVWLKRNGKAERRAVTVAEYRAQGVRVSAGLQTGDTLITDGYQKMYNGCEVVEDK